MKNKQELEKIQSEMIGQIPMLMIKVGETDNEEEGLMQIAAFTSKLAMVNYVLDDRGLPFHIIEEATIAAFDKVIENISDTEMDLFLKKMTMNI
jgi:uncharacterized protein YfkK (UPF0435 family)